ncbi:hypothetical protein Q0O85_24035 [Priestia megaterium]|uniref:hypothetical protein n=1 Tax=Priestia megaterium TaxID=1404 RepID=UPI00345B0A27
MFDHINRFFNALKSLYSKMFESTLGIKHAVFIIIIAMLMVAFSIKVPIDILNKLLFFGGLAFIYLTMLLCFIKYKNVHKVLLGKHKNNEELLTAFSHRSYIASITSFSFTLSLFTYGILMIFVSIFNISELKIDLVNYIMIMSSIVTVVWFLFHLTKEGVDKKKQAKKAKVYLRLYTAIATTVSLAFIWAFFEQSLKPFITYLAVSYAWVSFFIEAYEEKIQ